MQIIAYAMWQRGRYVENHICNVAERGRCRESHMQYGREGERRYAENRICNMAERKRGYIYTEMHIGLCNNYISLLFITHYNPQSYTVTTSIYNV